MPFFFKYQRSEHHIYRGEEHKEQRATDKELNIVRDAHVDSAEDEHAHRKKRNVENVNRERF